MSALIGALASDGMCVAGVQVMILDGKGKIVERERGYGVRATCGRMFPVQRRADGGGVDKVLLVVE